jgi:hypothetical protein
MSFENTTTDAPAVMDIAVATPMSLLEKNIRLSFDIKSLLAFSQESTRLPIL